MDLKPWLHSKEGCCCPSCEPKPSQKDITGGISKFTAVKSYVSDVIDHHSKDSKQARSNASTTKRANSELSCDKRDIYDMCHSPQCSCTLTNQMLSKKSYVTMTSMQRSSSLKQYSDTRMVYRKNLDVAKPYMALKLKPMFHLSTNSLKRKRKRHRTAFTPTQLLGLENAFERGHYLVGDERKQLAEFLRLSETQIKVWFQNRRTKFKRQRQNEFSDEYYDDLPLSENVVECLEALSSNHSY